MIILAMGAAAAPPALAADTAADTAADAAADTVTFTVTAVSAYLRATPSTQAPATYSVFQGQTFGILGRNKDNSWMQLDYPRATKGTWIMASLGKVTGDIGLVPVITNPSATATSTPGPTNQATTPTPAATGPSEICVLLYNDANGNGSLEPNEGVIAGGQLTIIDTPTGAVVQTYATTGREGGAHCFKDLPAGAYTVAATAPSGFNATTATSALQEAKPGEHYQINFGAQPGSGAAGRGGPLTAWFGPERANLLGGLIVVLLLVAAGATGFILMKRK